MVNITRVNVKYYKNNNKIIIKKENVRERN